MPAEQVADAGRTEDLSQQARDSSSAWHSPHVAKSHSVRRADPEHRCPGPAALRPPAPFCLRAHSPPSPSAAPATWLHPPPPPALCARPASTTARRPHCGRALSGVRPAYQARSLTMSSERSEVQLDACRRSPSPTPSDCSTPCRTAVAQQPPQVSQVLSHRCLIRRISSGNLLSGRICTPRVAPRPTPDPKWEGMIEGSAKHADGSRQDGRLTQSRSTFIAIPARWVSPVYQHARRPSIHMHIREGTKRASTDPDLYRAFPAGTVLSIRFSVNVPQVRAPEVRALGDFASGVVVRRGRLASAAL